MGSNPTVSFRRMVMKYDFVYVDFIPKSEKSTDKFLGLFQWGVRGIGFGEVTLVKDEDSYKIDPEQMDDEFLIEMFRFFVENSKR